MHANEPVFQYLHLCSLGLWQNVQDPRVCKLTVKCPFFLITLNVQGIFPELWFFQHWFFWGNHFVCSKGTHFWTVKHVFFFFVVFSFYLWIFCFYFLNWDGFNFLEFFFRLRQIIGINLREVVFLLFNLLRKRRKTLNLELIFWRARMESRLNAGHAVGLVISRISIVFARIQHISKNVHYRIIFFMPFLLFKLCSSFLYFFLLLPWITVLTFLFWWWFFVFAFLVFSFVNLQVG